MPSEQQAEVIQLDERRRKEAERVAQLRIQAEVGRQLRELEKRR